MDAHPAYPGGMGSPALYWRRQPRHPRWQARAGPDPAAGFRVLREVRWPVERKTRRDVSLKRRAARRDQRNGDPLPKILPLPGVLLANGVRSGKPACRCTRGALHGPYLYRRWREGGRQRRQYVRPAEVEQVRTGIEAWHDLHPPARALRDELAGLRRLLR